VVPVSSWERRELGADVAEGQQQDGGWPTYGMVDS
jgi:hypothetical protein